MTLYKQKSRGVEPCFFIYLRLGARKSSPLCPINLSINYFLSPGMIMGPHMGSAQFLPLSSSRVISSRFRSLLLISFLRILDCLLYLQYCVIGLILFHCSPVQDPFLNVMQAA